MQQQQAAPRKDTSAIIAGLWLRDFAPPDLALPVTVADGGNVTIGRLTIDFRSVVDAAPANEAHAAFGKAVHSIIAMQTKKVPS